ncbi:transcriptional regulator [Bradyrhizobium sp. HKCCYLS1011]|uniref:transcriptional regulator n=1 Tax=Bradyrhizobium sp. HKCCYLS1011 TaxID=3420733 RepID=UPI003EB9F2DC
MVRKKASEPSPESLARAERQRIASEEGAKAMAEFNQRAVDVRKNMERLRALRLAKEAEQAKTQADPEAALKKKRKRRIVR